MPRRAKLEPEAKPFTRRDFMKCVQALDAAQEKVDGGKEIMDAAKEAAEKAGFDVKLMDEMRKLKNKVEDGKVSIAAAQAWVHNTPLYAEAVGLMDQQDLFREVEVSAGNATTAVN